MKGFPLVLMELGCSVTLHLDPIISHRRQRRNHLLKDARESVVLASIIVVFQSLLTYFPIDMSFFLDKMNEIKRHKCVETFTSIFFQTFFALKVLLTQFFPR